MPDDVRIAGPGNALVLQFEPWSFGSEPKIDDFIRATAQFQGVGISASGIFDFFARDTAAFARAAEKAFSTLKGQASLSSDDSTFVLSVSFTNGGEVVVEGRLQPHYAEETHLAFSFATDQSYLGEAIRALKALTN